MGMKKGRIGNRYYWMDKVQPVWRSTGDNRAYQGTVRGKRERKSLLKEYGGGL